jgi:hypothetical protein
MAGEFKLPTSSYDELCKIIKGYARQDEPVELSVINTVTGILPQVISPNVGFLTATGLLTEGKLKQATPLGRKLGLALEHDQPLDVAGAWREVVLQTEFLNNMLAAIRIRKGMDAEALQNHIAYSAGATKSARTTTGSRAILNVLAASGLVQEQDGKLIAVTVESEPNPPVGTTPTVVKIPGHVGMVNVGQPSVPGVAISTGGTQLSIRINVQLNITPQDLPTLGQQLRQVIDELNKTTSTQPSIGKAPDRQEGLNPDNHDEGNQGD